MLTTLQNKAMNKHMFDIPFNTILAGIVHNFPLTSMNRKRGLLRLRAEKFLIGSINVNDGLSCL